jgi:hypothetical protein
VLHPPGRRVTFTPTSRIASSSSLCDRMMLRHPGECQGLRLGEDCSSAAFDYLRILYTADWFNLARRGSAEYSIRR